MQSSKSVNNLGYYNLRPSKKCENCLYRLENLSGYCSQINLNKELKNLGISKYYGNKLNLCTVPKYRGTQITQVLNKIIPLGFVEITITTAKDNIPTKAYISHYAYIHKGYYALSRYNNIHGFYFEPPKYFKSKYEALQEAEIIANISNKYTYKSSIINLNIDKYQLHQLEDIINIFNTQFV